MSAAGAVVPPRNLRGLSAEDKAKSIWARLRDRKVDAIVVLGAIAGVALCHDADPQKGKVEYRRVQIAKVLNRIAGGEVKRWPTHYTAPGLSKEKVLRWFPASEGLVLRVLGKRAEDIAEFLLADHSEALSQFHCDRLS
jgi:hypothetical protein